MGHYHNNKYLNGTAQSLGAIPLAVGHELLQL
jgi:hypothetical protein